MTRQQKERYDCIFLYCSELYRICRIYLRTCYFRICFSNLKWDGNSPIEFAALENFAAMIGNSRFIASFKNTIVYCIATVPLTLAAAIGLAVVLNQK